MKRVILIVLDSVGIGELPDADLYGDVGSNTLGNIALAYPKLSIPNLSNLGLGNIDFSNVLPKTDSAQAAYGKAAERSAGKDTTTGHWEIAGVVLDKPFPTFTKNGFPDLFIKSFEEAIGLKTIGNSSASGTAIINDLGDEHVKTGHPIVYTSADSVFQVAMHEEVIPIEKQYEICKIARDMLVDDLEVGRVIARPFLGSSGQYYRTKNRKDYATLPPHTVLDAIKEKGLGVYSIGKIIDIFAEKGITRYKKTKNNKEGILETIEAIKFSNEALIFTNLVDFDMEYGHRRDVVGYAKCLEDFDSYIPEIIEYLREEDLLIITADHGNDPTAPGTDHTREYIPILNYGKSVKSGEYFEPRDSFADIAATIAEYLNVDYKSSGASYWYKIKR
jgi:phosphopentomutase